MKIVKKLTAMLLASVLMIGSTTAAFAQTAESPNSSETTIIDMTEKPETSVIDSDKNPETTVVDDEELAKPEGGIDLSDIDYTPIDISGYEKWNGKTDMETGKNYYISGTVKLNKTRTVPEGSKLVLTPGSTLLLYKDKTFKVRGSMVIEPKSSFTASGKVHFYGGSTFENYGTVKGTVSSTFNVMSEFINRHDAEMMYSGIVNIYKNGSYINYGKTTLTQNSKLTCTGDFQTPENGKLINKGNFVVTINGRASFAGSFYLYGETLNSGVLIFEKTIKYYKSKSAKLAVSKSSRLIDYRYYTPSTSHKPDKGETSTDAGIKGIDVSYAQGAVNWQKVRQAGIEFAMLRASRGYISEKKPMAQDYTFEYNVTEATAVGIDVGVYHYLYASTVEEAIEEAEFFIQTISPYNITYPVVLDIEEQYQADLGKEKVTAMCKAFLDTIRDAGYYGMIYSNKMWLTNYIDVDKLEGYEVWLAQWNTVPTYDGEFGIWQYSSKGIVSGIDGYVDLNLSYKDYAKIIREGGYNNLAKDEAA